MPKYIIEDRVPCWVTWTVHVDAKDEDEAYENYQNGEYVQPGEPYIGDNLDWVDSEQEVIGTVPPDNVLSKPMKRKRISIK